MTQVGNNTQATSTLDSPVEPSSCNDGIPALSADRLVSAQAPSAMPDLERIAPMTQVGSDIPHPVTQAGGESAQDHSHDPNTTHEQDQVRETQPGDALDETDMLPTTIHHETTPLISSTPDLHNISPINSLFKPTNQPAIANLTSTPLVRDDNTQNTAGSSSEAVCTRLTRNRRPPDHLSP